ncbi:DMT family transporter [Crenobacter sp. SG2305]|uniref:DMT family transporter n=1 Tax=Crenobacter oryzisoli TaxID=3056844 RepID=UPI0025AA8EA7|nr:DMT family transporter [Crenobacter sp. SG2305]MDN0084582.1 DMT family transporter [Crenobacter sp. SG2305]
MKTDIPLSVTTNAGTHQSQAEQRGTALMVMGGLILGTIGIFVEEAAQSPVTTVLFRCLFGGLALLLWGLANRRLPELRLRGRALLGAIGAGLLMATNWGLFFAAIPRSSIGVATVIFHIQPFWVMAMGAWWLREKVSVQRAVAAVFALLGLALATGLLDGGRLQPITHDYVVGIAMCVVGSLAYAGVTMIAKVMSSVSSFALAWWQCTVGVMLTAWWPFVYGWPSTESAWAWLAGLGIIHTGLAYAVLYAGMSRLRTSRIALLQFVYPVTAILVDWAVYGHALSVIQVAGVLLMAFTLWSVRRSE